MRVKVSDRVGILAMCPVTAFRMLPRFAIGDCDARAVRWRGSPFGAVAHCCRRQRLEKSVCSDPSTENSASRHCEPKAPRSGDRQTLRPRGTPCPINEPNCRHAVNRSRDLDRSSTLCATFRGSPSEYGAPPPHEIPPCHLLTASPGRLESHAVEVPRIHPT